MKFLHSVPHTFIFDRNSPNPVVLVDDDDDSILLLQLLLKRSYVKNPIQIITDGEQAIRYFQNLLPRPKKSHPLIIFLDLKLPRYTGILKCSPGFGLSRCLKNYPSSS